MKPAMENTAINYTKQVERETGYQKQRLHKISATNIWK